MAQPQQATIQVQPPDPLVQAAIDAQYRPVDLKVTSDGLGAVCGNHSLETCAECGVDYIAINQIAKVLASFPAEMAIPPPPNVIHPQRSPMVTRAKEEGNVLFKANKLDAAIQKYNLSANIAASRFPWESSQLVRDELAVVVCNRSAAYFASSDYVSALVDADVVIQLKRPWSKGHFRKAKALLALGQLQEARESASLGLQFEPDSTELSNFVREIEARIEKEGSSPNSLSITAS